MMGGGFETLLHALHRRAIYIKLVSPPLPPSLIKINNTNHTKHKFTNIMLILQKQQVSFFTFLYKGTII
jgi:hypothetical protein